MPASDGKPSLLEFAASLKPQNVCRVCEIPEVKEINEARRQGVAYAMITRWLVTACGYEPGFISDHRVETHFRNNHHV